MSGRPPTAPSEVTPRQVEVARLVAAGYTNEQIARELGISHDGAKYHVSEILGRLGLQRREEIAEWYAREHGGTWRRIRAALGLPVAALAGGGAVVAASLVVIAFAALWDPSEEPVSLLDLNEYDVYVQLLAYLPDTPETRGLIQMGDHERVYALLGVERPAVDRDAAFPGEEYVEWLEALAGAGALGTAGGLPPVVRLAFPMTGPAFQEVAEAIHASMGVTVLDVHQWASSGHRPADRYVSFGRFDPADIAARLALCKECMTIETLEHRGWSLYEWGDEPGDGATVRPRSQDLLMDERPFVTQYGYGGRIAVADQVLLRAARSADVRAMVDAAAGDSSLATVKEFRLAAAAMGSLEALTFAMSDRSVDEAEASEMAARILDEEPPTFSDGTPVPGRGQEREARIHAWEVRDDDILLRPFIVSAAGVGIDDQGAYTALVLVHRTVEDAVENQRRFPGRLASARVDPLAPTTPQGVETWREAFSDMDSEVTGRVLSVKLRGHVIDSPRYLFSFDPLLLHE